MTKTTFRVAAAAGVAALALCAPPLASAGVVSLAEASGYSHLAAAVVATPAEDNTAERSMFSQGAVTQRRALPLRGQSDVALWNLVATVHAQQKARAFDLVDANVKTVWEVERNHVSAVPLPGAIWLFVMGLLGLAGTRVQRFQGEGRKATRGQALLPARPFAAA